MEESTSKISLAYHHKWYSADQSDPSRGGETAKKVGMRSKIQHQDTVGLQGTGKRVERQ